MSGITEQSRGMLLITRPEEDAAKLQTLLHEKGFATLVEPLLTIEPFYAYEHALQIALNRKPQAILITSRHAALMLSQATNIRNIPLIVAGKATAQFAIRHGFSHVTVAGLRASNIPQYMEAHYDPKAGHLLYLRGEDISVNITASLARCQFKVESVIVYKAKAAQRFSPLLTQALAAGEITAVLFFSERTAATYVTLATAACLQSAHHAVTALCMSGNIAQKLRTIPWKEVAVAREPDMEHMLSLIDKPFL